MDAFNPRVGADNARLREDLGAPGHHMPTMRLRPRLRIPELLEIWAAERKPSRQTEHETRRSVTELMDLHGDVAVSAVTRDMLLDYRDQSKRLP